jgi:hypothetical protein
MVNFSINALPVIFWWNGPNPHVMLLKCTMYIFVIFIICRVIFYVQTQCSQHFVKMAPTLKHTMYILYFICNMQGNFCKYRPSIHNILLKRPQPYNTWCYWHSLTLASHSEKSWYVIRKKRKTINISYYS